MQYKISVIIPCYGATNVIHQQLDGLSRQKDAPPFEIILSDNGKNEKLAQIIAPYSNKLAIKIVDATQRRGASYARNKGVEFSEGEFLLFCDADDIVEDYWVLKMSQSLDRAKDSLIGGEIIYGLSNTPTVLSRWGITHGPQVSSFKELKLRKSNQQDTYMGVAPRVPGNNFACRKKEYQAVNGFDESFGAGYEDCDFSWRMFLAGYSIYYNNASVDYKLRETLIGSFKQRESWEFQREHLRSRYSYLNVEGSSLKHSLKSAPIALFKLITQKNKLEEAGNLGASLGSIKGIISFRMVNR